VYQLPKLGSQGASLLHHINAENLDPNITSLAAGMWRFRRYLDAIARFEHASLLALYWKLERPFKNIATPKVAGTGRAAFDPRWRRRGDRMRRREFITLIGGAAAVWPLAAHAQQPAMPVVGFMSSRSADDSVRVVGAFRHGLAEAGYLEGSNVMIEFRWAQGQFDRLPALAAELVRLPVNVIAAVGGFQAPRAAKAVTNTIPIVFGIGEDPVGQGLVPSLNRPGANMTGATFTTSLLGAKRLGLLRELVPKDEVIGLLVNQNSSQGQGQTKDVQEAARALGQRLVILNGGSDEDIDAAFFGLAQQQVGALLVGSDPFFDPRRDRLIALVARHAVPAIYQFRDYLLVRGLFTSFGLAGPPI
jgi:putative ABC transport system substrate-binding protein